MVAPSEEAARGASHPGPSRGLTSSRFVVLLVFFGALNALGLWWIGQAARGGRKEEVPPGRPRVLAFWPRGEASPRQAVHVTFSRAVAPEDPARRPDPSRLIRLEPPLPGRARWGAADQLVFEPDRPLPRARELEIVLSPEIGLPGLPLEGPTRSSFATEPLLLLDAAQAGLGRDLQATLRLAFNDDVKPGLLEPHLKLLDARGVEVPFVVHEGSSARSVELRCQAASGSLTVVFGPAPPGRGGLEGVARERRREVQLSHVLRLTGAQGTRVSLGRPSLEIHFTNPVSVEQSSPPGGAASPRQGPARLEDYFSVEPPVALQASIQWSKVVLDGDFQPGSRYRLTVRRGLRGAEDTVLLEDASRDVYFPDREPAIAFPGEGTFLSSRGNLGLLLQTVNVASVDVRSFRVHPNNIVHALSIGWPRSSFTRAFPARRYDLPPGENQVRELVLDLRDLFGSDPRGVWYVEASAAGGGDGDAGEAEDAEKLVTVSDVGITAKESPHGQMVVWTVSLRTGDPLAGVAVSLRSPSNQLIAEATTGENGLAAFEGLSGLDGAPYVVLAEKGGDLAYLDLERRRVSRADFDVSGRPYLLSGHEAFAYTDRGVYRPGDVARFRAILRGPHGALPGRFPVEVETLRPNGKRLRSEVATLGPEGTVEAAVPISATASTGLYRTRIKLPGEPAGGGGELGSAAFRVEEYMPRRLRVEASLVDRDGAEGSPRRLASGETAEVLVRARYLFGAPAEGSRVEASWTLAPEPFRPHGWKGFRFGDLSPGPARTPPERAETVVDASGEARVPLAVPRVESGSALRLRFTVEVSDVGGRPVPAELSLAVDPAPHYLGMQREQPEGPVAGAPARFECVAVRPDGSLAGLEAAELTVWSVRWSSVLKRTEDGRYRYESHDELQEVAKRRVVLTGGRGAFELAFPAGGAYRLRLRDPASLAAAEVAVDVRGPGAGSIASSERPERLEIAFAKDTYRPGENARVVVRAPFAGALLLTTEGAGVETARVFRVGEGVFETDVPVPREAPGSFYAAATLVRGVDPDAPPAAHRAYGLAPVPVDLGDLRLVVTVAAPDEVRPAGRLPLRVQVAREDGEPAAGAEVSVAVVDEGILALTRRRTPDPFEFFHGRRAHAVEVADSFVSLLDEVPLERQRSRPGGDAGPQASAEESRLSPVASRRVKSTALWLGPFTTGEDGCAAVEVELPPFTGELCCYAVASAGNRFGSGDRRVPVRGPLNVELSLPRFVAPGDSFQVPVMVFNRASAPGSAAFSWTLDGLDEGPRPPGEDLAFAVLRQLSLEVPAGGFARIAFPLRAAQRIGNASARLTAVLGTESFGETVDLPVRPAAPRVERTEAGSVTAERPLEISFAREYVPGTARHRLVLGGLPSIELAGSLKYLLVYPYGCVEQTTSSAFPILYLKDLASAVGAGGAGEGDPGDVFDAAGDMVLAGIQRLLDMQCSSGALSWWPGARYPYAWGSVYGAHFLVEAREAGHPVPEEELVALLRYIAEDVVRGSRGPEPWRALERAYALYVLALARRPDLGAMDRLREELLAPGVPVDRAPASARFLLAGAYILARRGAAGGAVLPGGAAPAGAQGALAEPARALIGDVLPPLDPARDTGGALRSPAREDAILLSTLLEADPASRLVPELVERLRGHRVAGRWGTTQENAFALLALGKYARMKAGAVEDFRAEVRQGDEVLAVTGPGDVRTILGGDLAAPLRVSLEGRGALYYSWVEEGVPASGEVEEADRGLVVRRRHLDRDLKPLDPEAVPFGATVIVEITLEAAGPVDNVAVTDLLPAGLEVENPHLGGAEAPARSGDLLVPDHVSLRDDRVLVFASLKDTSRRAFLYAARAVTRGEFRLPPVEAEAMYDPRVRSVSGAGRLVVR
ncbi:MAG: alpha-2-macroglobulin family protein [Planctomycetes bacterium]|nr:alpha-2-macroglobulin family protein [Planctomycetota bacterium]